MTQFTASIGNELLHNPFPDLSQWAPGECDMKCRVESSMFRICESLECLKSLEPDLNSKDLKY